MFGEVSKRNLKGVPRICSSIENVSHYDGLRVLERRKVSFNAEPSVVNHFISWIFFIGRTGKESNLCAIERFQGRILVYNTAAGTSLYRVWYRLLPRESTV